MIGLVDDNYGKRNQFFNLKKKNEFLESVLKRGKNKFSRPSLSRLTAYLKKNLISV